MAKDDLDNKKPTNNIDPPVSFVAVTTNKPLAAYAQWLESGKRTLETLTEEREVCVARLRAQSDHVAQLDEAIARLRSATGETAL